MKIEAFFKPQAKAATAGQPGSSRQQHAEREKQRHADVEHEAKDIMPSLDRDVDKVRCLNACAAAGTLHSMLITRAQSGTFKLAVEQLC
jgi:hypothetical protein